MDIAGLELGLPLLLHYGGGGVPKLEVPFKEGL